MAANRSKSRLDWQDAARQKIQGSAIINRLIKHTLSEEEIMSASQVNAARVLLDKTLPNLKSMELTGEDGGPIILDAVSALEKVKKQLERGKS